MCKILRRKPNGCVRVENFSSPFSPPLFTSIGLKEFVVFLQNLSKTGEIQRLIILKQNEHQIEFAEGQFQIVAFAIFAALRLLLARSFHQPIGQNTRQRKNRTVLLRSTFHLRRFAQRFVLHASRTRLVKMFDFAFQFAPTSQRSRDETFDATRQFVSLLLLCEFLGEKRVDLHRFFFTVLKEMFVDA